MKKMTNLYAKAMETLIEKSRTASSKALFSLIALLFVSSNMWALDEYVVVTDFNGQTTCNKTELNSVSGGVFAKTVNHVTFQISNLSKYSYPCLVYGKISNYPGSNTSNFSWEAQNNYEVEVSEIKIGLRGYQATIGTTKPANAYFQSGSLIGTVVDCKTNATGGSGAKDVSISGDLITPTILNMATTKEKPIPAWSTVNTEFAITQITYTYKVTHKEYLFGFDATAEANNNLYGSATAFVSQNVIQAAVGVKNASTTATFEAQPKTGCQFIGWYDNSNFTGTPVSTSAIYTCPLENKTAGTIVSKTLYAKFDNKLQQTITWNQTIDNQIRGNEIVLNATASSGLVVTYTAYPADLVSIAGNTITCLKAGEVTITANQLGNENYHPSSNTPSKTFNILEHSIVTIPNASVLEYEQTLANSILTGGVANVEGTWSWKNPNIVPIAGVFNQIAVFTPLNPIITAFPLECEVEVSVSKAKPDVTCVIADNYRVEDVNLDLQSLWTREGDGKITYSLVSFVSTGINNEGAVEPNIVDNRFLSLGKAGVLRIQMDVAEGTNYVQRQGVQREITITKYDNALNCSWGEWTKKMNFDETQSVTFSANNTNSTTPIQIAQTDGDTIAQYVSGSVNSFHNEGTATWKVWQEEDYKYEAAEEKILTVNVGTENTTCYIINEPNEYVLGKGLDPIENGTPFSLNAQKGDKLYFDGRKTNGAVSYFFIQYSTDGGANYSDMRKQDLEPEWKTYGPYDIPEKTTHIRFVTKTGATLQKYYKNIKVTRAQWFDIEDKDGNAITSLTMPTNTIGGNATTADFYIDYSTCADEIKLHSSHPHITFGETGSTTMQFDSNGSGKQKITLTYSADEPEQISATITIYTPYEHKTITITAKTEKEQQELIWSDGFKGNPITIPLMSLMIDSAAVASSGLPVTYSTNNESVIKIADDNKSFEIIAEGTATLTAEQKGDERFLAVSDTKTINVVDKKIQYIIWGQDFTHGLNVGEEVTFDARAYTADVKNNAFTFDDARSALIQYTCPADNGVISIVDGKMTIIGYGKTAITASLAGDENHFEATPVIKTVHIREINDGECENIPVYDSDEEITFFAFNLEMPEIVNDIKLDPSNGVPDKLNFYVRGESYNVAIQYYNGGIDVYESTDGGNTWSDKLGEVWPEKNTTLYSDSIQLSPNATHIRLKRPKGGRGYHFVGGLVVSRKQFIEVEKEIINLGNVAAGAVRKGVIRFNYSDVKQDLQVTKANDSQINKLELDKTTIEVDCGATDKDSIAFVFRPMEIGNWSNMVTINDPKTGKSKTVTLTATVTIGEQQIIWNPETNIQQSTPPQLNAVTTSGLPVTYEVTSGTDVASIVDGQVIINKIGTFTITVKAPASSSFNPAELSVTFKVSEETVFIFESDGEWSNEDNWNKKTLPTENDAVIINANVAISEEATIKSMTINDEMKVTVKTTGKLTIKENGATGTGGGNLIIEATLGDKNNSGSSGQVVGAEKLNVRDAYFQMSFDPSGKITYGWYDFVVPFEVEILNGIYRQGESTSLRNNIDFIVMQHNEAARAAGTKDWKPYTGTMIPGKVYTITFDEQKEQNTFLFKKKTGAPLEGKNVFKAVCSQQGKTENRGWNGLGNGTLQHKQLMQSGKKVQIYDHTNNIYITKEADEYIFAVGTSFFMQIEANSDIELTEASLNLPLMAPAREGRTIDEFRLALTSNDEEKAADYMWISASEDAQGTYTIGHDLLKMGTPTEAKVAQMWITRENMHLCDVEMQLIDNTAQCTIDFFVPQTKQYTLHVDKAPKDASLYLTYNNQIIWNLTKSPYNMDLTKGTISGYGLILEGNRTPQITTGIEETNANEQDGTRKVLINNQIYLITSDGAIYTMTGTKIQ